MKIVLRDGNYFVSHTDLQNIEIHYSKDEGYSIIIVPDDIKLKQRYAENGYDLEKPDPRNVLTADENLRVKIETAKYNRKIKEQSGIEWEGNRFATGVDACGTLSLAVANMTSGLIAKTVLNWRTADGVFIDMDVAKLTELLGIILQETEANYDAEKAEIEA